MRRLSPCQVQPTQTRQRQPPCPPPPRLIPFASPLIKAPNQDRCSADRRSNPLVFFGLLSRFFTVESVGLYFAFYIKTSRVIAKSPRRSILHIYTGRSRFRVTKTVGISSHLLLRRYSQCLGNMKFRSHHAVQSPIMLFMYAPRRVYRRRT